MRDASHIDRAFSIYQEKKASCVISVFEPKHPPTKAYVIESNGTITGLLNPSAPYTRRQDLPVSIQPNGAIYIFNRTEFFRRNQIPRKNVYPFIMTENESIDIDDIDDLKSAQKLLEKKL